MANNKIYSKSPPPMVLGDPFYLDMELSKIETAFTDVVSANAEINTAVDALARGDISALKNRVNTLEGSQNDALGLIQEEEDARTAADATLGQYISTLQTQVGNNLALLETEVNNRITADSAISNQITTLEADFDNNAAAVQQSLNTLTTATSANASAITTVQTQVGANAASVAVVAESVDGVKAKWGVTINNNGAVTGIELNSGEDQKSMFKVQADKFQIEPQAGAAVSPFYVESNTTYIENAVIKNGSITQVTTGENETNDLTLSVQFKAGSRVSIIASHLANGSVEVLNGTPGFMYVHVNGNVIMQRPLAIYRYRNTNFFAANQPTTYQVSYVVPSDGTYSIWLANRPGTGSGTGSVLTIIEQRK